MIAFSENKPLWIKPILALLLWGVATASGGISTNYQVTIESRLAYHAFNPRDLASHRHTLNADQKKHLRVFCSRLANHLEEGGE